MEQPYERQSDSAVPVWQHYREGMLPYGGRTNCNGITTYAVSGEEFLEKMRRLASIR
ncbi:hypothetical protein ASZ90_011177 [hydrocarbon metagenome]|uniref:Uncharacterized protein n=1 Tax=hydrocarbon metagenome TaxID=938273 RepID=A0A0W8FDZ1_9ZZZZ